MPIPCTLALDCSTALGSVALAEDETAIVLWNAQFPAGRGQGGELFAALQTALGILAGRGGTLGEIVVGLGPGSYSGVRQAIAAGVGLSLSTNARLTGVPSGIAWETGAAAYQTLGDARRGTYYYAAVENGVCAVEPELLLPDALLARLAERPGWPVFADGPLPPDLELASAPAFAQPRAERLLTAPPASRKPAPLEPIYLRAPNITVPKPHAAKSLGNAKSRIERISNLKSEI